MNHDKVKTLTDWSALNKVVIKPQEPPKKPALSPKKDDGEDVIAYFSRRDTAPNPTAESEAGGEESVEVAALKSELAALAKEKSDALSRAEQAEMIAGSTQKKFDDLQREVNRLKGDNARLKGEAAKAAETAQRGEEAKADQPAASEPARPQKGVLAAPMGFTEAFDGELREIVVSVLADALDAAENGERQRRVTILKALLAANKSSGELERRRAEVKQILKDAGYYNDPKPLEKLGFKLISGRTHWKLEYADVRMPLSKTPSDYRANQNTAAEMIKRCF